MGRPPASRTPSFVILLGAPGLGKTLLQSDCAHRRKRLTARAWCAPRERAASGQVPFIAPFIAPVIAPFTGLVTNPCRLDDYFLIWVP
jgi:hypothetical protein